MYTIIVWDMLDCYYYADFGGKPEIFDREDNLDKAKAIADALFVVKNYKWESLSEMNDCDGGYDVRVYDQNQTCVYRAHESFKENWIGQI